MLGMELAEGAPDEHFVPRNGQCLSTRLNFNEEGGGVGNGGQMSSGWQRCSPKDNSHTQIYIVMSKHG